VLSNVERETFIILVTCTAELVHVILVPFCILLQVTMATPAPVIAKVEGDPSADGITPAFDDDTGGTAENFVDDVSFDMDSFVTSAAFHSEVVATTVACDTNDTASNLAINCNAFSIDDLYGNAMEFNEQTYETFTDVDMSELCDRCSKHCLGNDC